MKQHDGYYIAENESDFDGYEILYVEHYKENVKRVWMRKDRSFYIIYSDEQYTKNLQEINNGTE